MEKEIIYEKYAYTKNVIYQLYPVLKKLSEEELEKIFITFKELEVVARNTYLFPYDYELWHEIKSINQSELLLSNLQNKYNITDRLILEKYQEYHLFEFGKLLQSQDLLDLDALKKFHYDNKISNKKV